VRLGHVRTYCQDLGASVGEDEAGSKRIATAVASSLPPAMRTIGEATEEQLAMAADLILFAGDLMAPSAPLSRSNEQTVGSRARINCTEAITPSSAALKMFSFSVSGIGGFPRVNSSF
jgi:hypothetical protein